MQNINAKLETLVRYLGMIFLLIAIPFTIISDYILMNNSFIFFLYMMSFLLWFLFFILSKFAIDLIIDNEILLQKLLLLFTCIMGLVSTLLIIFIMEARLVIVYLIQTISILMLIFCWNFSLSIFKKKKYIFIVSGVVYLILTLIFDIASLNINEFSDIFAFENFFAIFSVLLTLIGIIFIILGELRMKQKGLLHYI
jgi:hypothetical protein